ncbi:MAG: TolC family protein, partial [Croceibacterium sp.]
ERAIAAATARIGVAEAARYPKISFMGILGLGGTSPDDLLDLDNLAAIALPQIQWNFLDFGRNNARAGQAEAARDEAEAKYRQSVLGALRDAEDALARFGRQRELVAGLARIADSTAHVADLTRQRYRAGVIPRADSLEADRQALVARQSLQTATAVLTGSYVAVNKALGLGWDAAPQP